MDSVARLVESTGIANLTLGHVVMIGVCLGLIYLAVRKQFEPLLP